MSDYFSAKKGLYKQLAKAVPEKPDVNRPLFTFRVGSQGGYRLLKCKICGQAVDYLTKAHMANEHGITKEKYCIDNPEHAYAQCWGDAERNKEPWEKWRTKGGK